MNAPSITQSKRRQLFGILTGAVLLPALVALAVPDGAAETEVATVPIAAVSAPADTAASSTTTTEDTTTSASAEQPAVSVSTTAKPSTTTTTAPVPKKVAFVAPTTTTTAPPVAAPAPPPPPPVDESASAFLACVRQRESHGNYSIVSSNGMYHGAYQFSVSTWNLTAQHAGRGDLVGVLPSQASPADQDAMALALYKWQGKAPWGGYC